MRIYRRWHVVGAAVSLYKVLQRAKRERLREIIIRTCEELGVQIMTSVLARDYVYMFLSFPTKLFLSDVMPFNKNRSPRRILTE